MRMRKIMAVPILGLVDKTSYLEMIIDDLYVGSKKYINVKCTACIRKSRYLAAKHLIESFVLKLRIDDEIIEKKNIELDLAEGRTIDFDIDIEVTNIQPEVKMFKLELDDIKNNKIDYTDITEMVIIEPVKVDSKAFVKLIYMPTGHRHDFSYIVYSPDARVYYKLNNNNWKEIKENDKLSFNNNELEGDINYLQLYTTDEENRKIYSNVVRFVKK